ncbi:MAG: hypothetical protein IJT97_06765 [Bacteroidaceae bacterium]|nr:hypothetical protein [Bacteroidaceae bacterium]
MDTTKNKRTTVSLPEYAMKDIREEAKRRKSSMSSIMLNYILMGLYHEPNSDTLETIEEAKSGAEMEELTPYDIEHFEEYVAGL